MLSHMEGSRDGERQAMQRIADSNERLLSALEKERIDFDAREQQALERIASGQERIATGQERLFTAIEKGRATAPSGGGLDEETRQRIRSLDVQMLRILEEMTAGRQDALAELRSELRRLAQAIASASDRPR